MEAVQWSQMEHALSTHKALLRSIYIHIFNTLYVVLIPLSLSWDWEAALVMLQSY